MSPEDLKSLSDDALQAYAANQRAMAGRADEVLKQRKLARRLHLAEFMKEHREMFILFFELGGCAEPEAAVDHIAENPLEYRPCVYAQRDEL